MHVRAFHRLFLDSAAANVLPDIVGSSIHHRRGSIMKATEPVELYQPSDNTGDQPGAFPACALGQFSSVHACPSVHILQACVLPVLLSSADIALTVPASLQVASIRPS